MKIIHGENESAIWFELYPSNASEKVELRRLVDCDHIYIGSREGPNALQKKCRKLGIDRIDVETYHELPNYNRIVLIHVKPHARNEPDLS